MAMSNILFILFILHKLSSGLFGSMIVWQGKYGERLVSIMLIEAFLTLVGFSTVLCGKFCVKYDILWWRENLSSMKSCLPSDDNKQILLMENLPFSFPFNVYGLLSEQLVCNPFLHDLILRFHKGSSNIWYLRTLY